MQALTMVFCTLMICMAIDPQGPTAGPVFLAVMAMALIAAVLSLKEW